MSHISLGGGADGDDGNRDGKGGGFEGGSKDNRPLYDTLSVLQCLKEDDMFHEVDGMVVLGNKAQTDVDSIGWNKKGGGGGGDGGRCDGDRRPPPTNPTRHGGPV